MRDNNLFNHSVNFSIRKIVLFCSVLIISFFVSAAPLIAVSTYLSESYTASEALPVDSIVSLSSKSNETVVLANTNNVDSMIGVVIDRSDSSITLESDTENQVQVATSGTLQVLASDINGSIEPGDYITASPISGVGMRASGSTKVIGMAQSALVNGVPQEVETDGTVQKVNIGTTTVVVSISGYIDNSGNSFIPRPIQEVANTLAGRTVESLPIVLSLGVFVVTLIVVTVIIYSMVRNGIISVGRNPLSSSAIYRNVILLSVLILGILVGAGVIIYFILTRM